MNVVLVGQMMISAVGGLVDGLPDVSATVQLIATIDDPAPDASVPGGTAISRLLGWLKYLGLAGSLACFFIGGTVWGLGQIGGNGGAASKGRLWAMAGAAGTLCVALGGQVVNQLYQLG